MSAKKINVVKSNLYGAISFGSKLFISNDGGGETGFLSRIHKVWQSVQHYGSVKYF